MLGLRSKRRPTNMAQHSHCLALMTRKTAQHWSQQQHDPIPSFHRSCQDHSRRDLHWQEEPERYYKDHPCNRHCEDNSLPRLCKYTWLLENYYVMSKACHDCPFNQTHCYLPHCVSADGVMRGIKTANRILPGPRVEVCEGDTIEVTVMNAMEVSEGTSIHWHGIHQRGTPFMDGVAMLTQCPIPAHAKFTYRFTANNPGTHFWHAHAGVQRADGLFGSLVIRRPPSRESQYLLYDYDLTDHVIIVNDWLAEMTVNRFAAHHHDSGDNKPELMLINGRGQYREVKDSNGTSLFTPRATFTVKPGKRYRFRVINAGILNCPIQFSVNSHTMTMIASDGHSFEPYTVDMFNIFSGERYDFVLYADKEENLRNYWIRVKGLADCNVKSANQTAILKYEGAPDDLPPESLLEPAPGGTINSTTTLEQVKAMDARGELNRNKTKAPLKDSVTVPDGGYTIVRFKADNPGIWFFHCHIEFHAEIGMGLFFQVGNKSQFPKPPKNFPKCGDFLNDESDDTEKVTVTQTVKCTSGCSDVVPWSALVLLVALSITFKMGINI
ncbi:laccase-4 [Biomphalaria pfeifferi]|uniref:Laccase-4 n=1 Tax=Biomphalaria pfeifferi TaxID=112525 RepID=A0AAD8C4U9_BIOPF|nr:laccase-4 [Biomphalaria pfeifferi]